MTRKQSNDSIESENASLEHFNRSVYTLRLVSVAFTWNWFFLKLIFEIALVMIRVRFNGPRNVTKYTTQRPPTQVKKKAKSFYHPRESYQPVQLPCPIWWLCNRPPLCRAHFVDFVYSVNYTFSKTTSFPSYLKMQSSFSRRGMAKYLLRLSKGIITFLML